MGMTVLGQSIKGIMHEQGIKQYVIAERAGLTAQQFSAMLHGRRTIGAEMVPKLAEALGVTPNELFGVSAVRKKADGTNRRDHKPTTAGE